MPALQLILAEQVRNGVFPTSLSEDIGGWISQHWEMFLAWISQPREFSSLTLYFVLSMYLRGAKGS